MIEQTFQRVQVDRVQRQKQQGLGKGIISTRLDDHRVVAVGNQIYTSKVWRTFHDFLGDFLIAQLGREWFLAEEAKPDDADCHPVVRWYKQARLDIRRFSTKVGDLYRGPMTGAQRAFINLAYNVYLIAHHAEPSESEALVASFTDRLKSERTDDFVGKLFETYAAAAFLKAGFKLAYEDERDGTSSHVEFVATYPATRRKFSVEVKTRNQSSTEDGPTDEIKRLRVGNKLNKALSKKANHTRVVMIEVNVPDIITAADMTGWPHAALEQIRKVEKQPQPDGSPKPSAYVLVTNHAFHNNLSRFDPNVQVMATGCQISDFGPDVRFNGLKVFIESQERHKEMFALLDSMRTHYEVPVTFEGENPEFAFGVEEGVPRLRIGETYSVPDEAGNIVNARLVDAIVMENEKSVLGIYATSRGHHMGKTPMTDTEFAAWKRHPDTFFGVVRKIDKPADNWIEMALLFHDVYKAISREKLLEFMKGAKDVQHLQTLSQSDLAITYCERVAWSVFKDQSQ